MKTEKEIKATIEELEEQIEAMQKNIADGDAQLAQMKQLVIHNSGALMALKGMIDDEDKAAPEPKEKRTRTRSKAAN